MIQKDLTRRSAVAYRLKSVRGMLTAADDFGTDDIQEDLPKAAMAAHDMCLLQGLQVWTCGHYTC